MSREMVTMTTLRTDATRMGAATPDLALSIVSHGHGALLQRLLSQLNAEPSLAGVKVVVTLNLPGERFDPGMFPELDITVIRNSSPRGFGANHNAAFEQCAARWFGILNPDLALAEGEPFSTMILRADTAQAQNIGLVAPRVVAANLAPEDSVRGNLTPWSLIRRSLGSRTPLSPSGVSRRGSPFYWVAGMCMLARAQAYRDVGGFDERFFLYCEDFDLCARMYDRGFGILLDDRSRIIHEAQRDSHRSWKHLRWHLASLMKAWCSPAFWRITFASLRLK